MQYETIEVEPLSPMIGAGPRSATVKLVPRETKEKEKQNAEA